MRTRTDMWTDQAYRMDTADLTHTHVIEGIVESEASEDDVDTDNVTFTVTHNHDHGYVAHSHVQEWRPLLRMVAFGIEVNT